MGDDMDFLDDPQKEDQPTSQDDLDLETVMKTKAGRATMHHMLDMFGLWDDTYATNPHDHARIAGIRGAGKMLENKLKDVTPLQYNQMMKEKLDGHF